MDANNRPTEEDQCNINEILRILDISYKDHTSKAIVCSKLQVAIGPYEEKNLGKGNDDGSDMWSVQLKTSVRRPYNEQCQEKGKRKYK